MNSSERLWLYMVVRIFSVLLDVTVQFLRRTKKPTCTYAKQQGSPLRSSYIPVAKHACLPIHNAHLLSPPAATHPSTRAWTVWSCCPSVHVVRPI